MYTAIPVYNQPEEIITAGEGEKSATQKIYYGVSIPKDNDLTSGDYRGKVTYTITATDPPKPAIASASPDDYYINDRVMYLGGDGYMLVSMKSGRLWETYSFSEGSETGLAVGSPSAKELIVSKSTEVDLTSQSSANFIITDDDRLLSWGENDSGQLGDGTTVSKDFAGRVDITSSFFGKDIASAQWSVNDDTRSIIILFDDGTVITWGNNRYGQLGDGTKENKLLPVDITNNFSLEGRDKIIQVSSSGYEMMALSESGRVFVLGEGSFGGGGVTPVDITEKFGLRNGERVKLVSAGSTNGGNPNIHGHAVAVTTDNRIFVWGVGNCIGSIGDSYGKPVDATQYFSFNKMDYPAKIFTPSDDYSYITTENGRTYELVSDWSSCEEGTDVPRDITNVTHGKTPRSFTGWHGGDRYVLTDDGGIYNLSSPTDNKAAIFASGGVSISGSNFAANSTVFIDLNDDGVAQDNELCANIKVANGTEITCNVPIDENITPGTYNLYVQTDHVKSDPVEFRYEKVE